MSGESAKKRVPTPQTASRLTLDHTLLSATVDRRTRRGRRFRDLTLELEAEAPGEWTPARRALLRRAVSCAMLCEAAEEQLARGESVDLTGYNRLTNTLRRTLGALGIHGIAMTADDARADAELAAAMAAAEGP